VNCELQTATGKAFAIFYPLFSILRRGQRFFYSPFVWRAATYPRFLKELASVGVYMAGEELIGLVQLDPV
jgi:hypothetical protein